MPFTRSGRHSSPPPPRRGRQQQQGRRGGTYDEPLLRLGGLFPSKRNDHVISGSINLDYAKDGEPTIGEQFADLLERALAEGKRLRFVIFESDGRFPGPPYSINVTLAEPRQPDQGRSGVRDPWGKDDREATKDWGPPSVEDGEEGEEVPPVEEDSSSGPPPPSARPGRRIAPRRG